MPMNSKSKGYGNLGRGSLRNLAKAHRSKELEQAEDAQKDEMGKGSPKAMEWVKEAQNKMNTSPMVILGHWN